MHITIANSRGRLTDQLAPPPPRGLLATGAVSAWLSQYGMTRSSS